MKRLRRFYPFIITISIMAIATLAKIFINQAVSYHSPFLLYFSAVFLTAWLAGPAYGFLGVALACMASSYQFIGMAWVTQPYWLFRLALFCLDSGLIVLLTTAVRRSRRKTMRALDQVRQSQLKSMASEEKFRRIFESNVAGFIFCKASGEIIDANESFLNMLQLSREDLTAQTLNWKNLTPVELRAVNEKAFFEAFDHGFVAPFETEYVDKSGRHVPVLIGASHVSGDMLVSFALDISERRHYEDELAKAYESLEDRVAQRTEELDESRNFLNSVIENIPNMIFVKEARTLRFMEFNKAGEELLGYRREEMIGKNDFDFFPKDEARFFIGRDREVFKTGRAIDIPEEPITTKDGIRLLHTKKIPIFDKDGRPLYLIGISEDITERQAIESQKIKLLEERGARAAAEKTAERLAFMAAASATLTESLDMSSTLTSFARVLAAHFGDWCVIDLLPGPDAQLVSTTLVHRIPELENGLFRWRELFPCEDDTVLGSAQVHSSGVPQLYATLDLEKLTSGLSTPAVELVFSKLRPHSVISVPIQSYGVPLGVLTIVSSDEAITYNELDLSVAVDLARRVSFAVENSRLYAKSQEASQAKSAFLANVSHEIRTPLGAVLGFAELLESTPLNEREKSYAATIIKNGRQLLNIVDEILDLSKVESNRVSVEFIQFSLKHLIEDVIALLRVKAEAKHLDLFLHMAGEIPNWVKSDPTRLRQILLNVIGNAIKFTESGRIDVRVKAALDGLSGRWNLEFTISDTGIGISSDQRAFLFQPFSQADSSMTRRFGGTGLGLFLSKKLALLLGGDLVLSESIPGQGSTFDLRVKVEEVDLEAERVVNGAGSSTMWSSSHSERDPAAKVLVVDDSIDNRILIGYYLSAMDIDHEMAESGEEAIEKIKADRRYNVILMDLQMPGMDGMEALKQLRNQNYQVPVVALTAHAMKGDRERCIAAGFDDYLCKPINRGAFTDCVAKYVSSRKELSQSL